MATTPESRLMAAPAEIRQQILQNLFTNEIRTNKDGEIFNMPWQLQSVCKLLKEDVDTIQNLWSPPQYATLLVTYPKELPQLPSVIAQLKQKTAKANNGKQWSGFEEAGLIIFHPTAIKQVLADLPDWLSKDQVMQSLYLCVVREWDLNRYVLRPTLNPEVTRIVKSNLTLPKADRDAVKGWSSRKWDSMQTGAWCVLRELAEDYSSAFKGDAGTPFVQMEDRKGNGVQPRIEFTGILPKEHKATFEKRNSEAMIPFHIGGIEWI
ncbi:uncharacterized protein BDZ99DRAFT_513995 [Mytilinidion resinicola]|uniref:Uncharacterized protein n=1 Tax=Mytilinidion resinicola TaxID=574789 RepID=A0A6A6Z9T5_9PEZI|nr:uncharacterized protein BDZ99DRAFT_513995 [Mytilinidion resinicola]KAF2817776.1 hypothetical protein BDZ99DRAFT_513995 [Mytilinidion resinicola]